MAHGFEEWTEEDVLKHNERVRKELKQEIIKGKKSDAEISLSYAIDSIKLGVNFEGKAKVDTLDKPKKKSKYGAKKTQIDGIIFDSMKEANRYTELKLMEKAGEISNLEIQVPFILQEKYEIDKCRVKAIVYVADFSYIDKNGQVVIEDVKGFRTKEYKLKKKLFEYKYNLKITEV